jgi:predicted lipoprotein
MQTISVNYTLKWQCKFDNKYQWSECGKLFNANTGRMKKKVLNGGSIGYWIGRTFYTVDNLRKEIELIPKNKLPF